MFSYIVKRIGWIIVNLLVLSLATFFLIHAIPGSFMELQILLGSAGYGAGMTLAELDKAKNIETEMMKRWGPQTPLWEQYWLFVKGLVTFNMGPSFRYPTINIQEILLKTFPVSFIVAVSAVMVALAIGIPLGTVAALKQNTIIDYLASFLAMVGSAIPNYIMAVFLIFIFSFWIPILPTYGWGEARNYVLPILAMAFGPIGTITGYMRTALLDVLKQDYIRTAWAKGGTAKLVIMGHAMKNALIPLVTVAGPMVSGLIVGTVFVEGLFGVPGMGSYFTTAANSRDYPLIMTQTVVFAILLMVMNLLVDITYFFLNPRLRLARR